MLLCNLEYQALLSSIKHPLPSNIKQTTAGLFSLLCAALWTCYLHCGVRKATLVLLLLLVLLFVQNPADGSGSPVAGSPAGSMRLRFASEPGQVGGVGRWSICTNTFLVPLQKVLTVQYEGAVRNVLA
jgi:hypothetical protein